MPEPEFEYTGTSLVVILKVTKLTKKYRLKLRLSPRESKIIEYIDDHKEIKSKDIQKIFGVTRDTANRWLRKLIRLKIVEKQGIGKATYYTLKNK